MTRHTGLSVPEGYGIAYETAVEVATAAGCEFVEVLLDGRGRPETLAAELGPALDGSGLALVVHLPFTVPVWSPFDAHATGLRRTHEACLDAAADLGATAAVVHPAGAAMGDATTADEVVAGVCGALQDLHAFGAERGITVCVENVQSGPFTLAGLEHVLARTDAPLVVDTGHARVSGDGDEALHDFCREHGDRVAHVHCNDTRGATDEHLPLGCGTVDFGAVVDALGADWDGRLCAEPIVADPAALASSLAHLDKVLAAGGGSGG